MGDPAQWEDALARANSIRLKRADTKRWIGADGNSRESAARAIQMLADELPEHMRSMRVGDFLLAIHRFGKRRVMKTCGELRIGEMKKLEDLTPRQREALQAELRRARDGAGARG